MIKLLLADDEGIVLESMQRIVAKILEIRAKCGRQRPDELSLKLQKNFDRISQY